MQIRTKIFETNSSSSHSVVCAGTQEFATVDLKDYRWKDGKVTISETIHDTEKSNEHYREFSAGVSNHWNSVAELCLAWARYCGTPEHVEMLKNVIQDYTKLEVIFGETKNADWADDLHGECDHKWDAPCPNESEILEAAKEKIKEFVIDMSWAFKTQETLKVALFQNNFNLSYHNVGY